MPMPEDTVQESLFLNKQADVMQYPNALEQNSASLKFDHKLVLEQEKLGCTPAFVIIFGK
jgi:hypothetical protein